MTSRPGGWPPGTATGIGSLPGDDPTEIQARVLEALPDWPHLVELPGRGPGADLIGRGAALLTDLHVDLQPFGWRFVPHPGRDLARARDLLARDCDTLAEAASGWQGLLKLQACGPWTLAAGIELQRGGRAVADGSAVADIAASLAEGLAAHVRAVAASLPHARLTVQIDEPSLPGVLAGDLPTPSGLGRLRVPEPAEARDRLAAVLGVLPRPGVHCCAAGVPVGLLRAAGAEWVSLDTTLLTARDDEAMGEAFEAGAAFLLGVEPTGDAAALEPVLSLWRRLGVPAATVLAQVALSPRCGLAGSAPEAAWASYAGVAANARRLAEQVGEAA